MTPEPFFFQHSLADFDITKLPLDPQVLDGNPSILTASVRAYYEELLTKLGGTAAVAIANGVVSVQWYPGTGDAVEMVFDHACKLLEQGDHVSAEPLLRMLLGRMPDDPRFLYNLGMSLSDQGKTEEAIELLEALVENEPGSSNGWTALGVAYARNGQHDKVEDAFRRALEIDPTNPHALRNLGALRNQSAPEEALEDLWKAARLLPKDQGAQFAYARCLLDLGQSGEADAILTKVIELDPLSEIAEMAKAERRKLAHERMRASVNGGLRMDAVFYCLDALRKFADMSADQMKSVVFEIAVLGQSGLDINDLEEKYTLKSLPGSYSGLHLVSLMYAGFKKINPALESGIDLSREYAQARKLAGLE